MSLLDTGPHTVRVYLEEESTDFRGNKVYRPRADSPVTVSRCWMQPVASTRGAFAALRVNEGQDVSVAFKLIARSAPVGWWSRVEWDDPGTGTTRRFSVLGGPLVRNFTGATRHISVTLTEER